MEPAELETLADLIVGKLSGPVVSSVVPAWVTKAFSEHSQHRLWECREFLPMDAGWGFSAHWQIDPDGTLRLTLYDINGQIFWRGSFRAA